MPVTIAAGQFLSTNIGPCSICNSMNSSMLSLFIKEFADRILFKSTPQFCMALDNFSPVFLCVAFKSSLVSKPKIDFDPM